MAMLSPGVPFPSLHGPTLGHGPVTLPEAIPAGQYGIVLAYRAHWWPYCNRQLADFQELLPDLEALGVSVYALTTDPAEKVRETVARHGLTFPVLYGMEGPATAERLGAFYEERRNIIQPAAFILAPGGAIASVTYSSGPVGRLTAADAASHIAFRKEKGLDKP